ncbi:hypothetical protein HALO98_70574 [Vreelandella titanicae]|nr:hypothetical protein HALO98_70574 [Halomonas titanicae]
MLRLGDHAAPVSQPESVTQFAPKEDIIHGVQIGDQAEFLEDDTDARVEGVLVAMEIAYLAIDVDLTFILSVDAAENFHQSRLAGPVFAKQSMHLASMDIERYIREGPHPGK